MLIEDSGLEKSTTTSQSIIEFIIDTFSAFDTRFIIEDPIFPELPLTKRFNITTNRPCFQRLLKKLQFLGSFLTLVEILKMHLRA